MNSYAEASAAASGHEPGGDGLCAAFGCCLPGTLTMSTQGAQDWHCRLHFGAPRAEFDDISARIQNRKALFTAAYWLVNRAKGDAVASKVLDRIKALGRADIVDAFAKGDKQTAYHLGTLLLRVLGDECRMPQAHMGTPKPAGQGTTWLDQSQPEEATA
ncbi:hypothetical protein [Achromobacter aegrifaciens]|uniref:hypothetical protein n=1 Tax=Achromobacter aegrifaciens TaxID=1287736 RepID=UPI000F74A78D|nr:hypothetical protein [Achromobacter aegrifaciens]RSE90761.1 hypothetical protein EGU54_32200 [Achromobacter aegrifaciens]